MATKGIQYHTARENVRMRTGVRIPQIPQVNCQVRYTYCMSIRLSKEKLVYFSSQGSVITRTDSVLEKQTR